MAAFQVAAVFSDNMVLQRDKVIRIFGEGEDNTEVTVALFRGNGAKICDSTCVVRDGYWTAFLPPLAAEERLCLRVGCGDVERVFDNVAIGEVWLCGGQSNMEMELRNIAGGREHLQNDAPKVRFYYTQKRGYLNEAFFESERRVIWREFSAETAACWSGVGYLFAKRLSERLGVTVGLIGCNWGGTSASAWMSKEKLTEHEELRIYWDEYAAKISGRSVEEQQKEYTEYEVYRDEWQTKCDACYAENPAMEWEEILRICGDSRWPGPMNCVNPFRPCGLYETMIQRVAPYTLRGFLYYQGESDDHRPQMYEKLMKQLIANWREDWYEKDLPFLFVQLPGHRYKGDPDDKHWCGIREAQWNVFRTVKNTGMAVTIDAGEFNEIHPKDKEPVAERLYRQALRVVYELCTEEEANGPMYRDSYRKGNAICCRFAYAREGFAVKESLGTKEPIGFEIAGVDGDYVPAQAILCGSEILVSSTEICEPYSVRYQWRNFGEVNLYGKNGIPVAPFRTNPIEGQEGRRREREIKQRMEL